MLTHQLSQHSHVFVNSCSDAWLHFQVDSSLSPKTDISSRVCLAPVNMRSTKPFRKVRLSQAEPENKELWRITQELAIFFRNLLNNTAMSSCDLKSVPAEVKIPALVVQCVHDAIEDPSTGKKVAPQFIVDCTDMCNVIADIATKAIFGDQEQELYAEMVANAQIASKIARTKMKKLAKEEAKKLAKVKLAAKKGQKACQKAQKAFEKIRTILDHAKKNANEAETKVKAVTQKAKKAIEIQSEIVRSWRTAVKNLDATAATLELLEDYCLWLPSCEKCKGSCECKSRCVCACVCVAL